MHDESLENTNTSPSVLRKEVNVGLRNRMPKMWGGQGRFRPSGNFAFRTFRTGLSVRNRARLGNRGMSWRGKVDARRSRRTRRSRR